MRATARPASAQPRLRLSVAALDDWLSGGEEDGDVEDGDVVNYAGRPVGDGGRRVAADSDAAGRVDSNVDKEGSGVVLGEGGSARQKRAHAVPPSPRLLLAAHASAMRCDSPRATRLERSARRSGGWARKQRRQWCSAAMLWQSGAAGDSWLHGMDGEEGRAATAIQCAWRARGARLVAHALTKMRGTSRAVQRLRMELARAERVMQQRLEVAAAAAVSEAETAQRSEQAATAAAAESLLRANEAEGRMEEAAAAATAELERLALLRQEALAEAAMLRGAEDRQRAFAATRHAEAAAQEAKAEVGRHRLAAAELDASREQAAAARAAAMLGALREQVEASEATAGQLEAEHGQAERAAAHESAALREALGRQRDSEQRALAAAREREAEALAEAVAATERATVQMQHTQQQHALEMLLQREESRTERLALRHEQELMAASTWRGRGG